MTWSQKWRQNLREDRRQPDCLFGGRGICAGRKEIMSDFSYEILDLLTKYENDTNAALEGETSPQCLYAFSPLRENLFEWVEFENDARILQIGSDYGSYTGLLAARAGEVVVLDARDESLEVNRLRHGEKKNVRYVCGEPAAAPGSDGRSRSASAAPGPEGRSQNMADAPGPDGSYRLYKPAPGTLSDAAEIMARPFDYVVMAGIFEQYPKEDAAALLNAAAGFLKPGGKLFAAVENEVGVRYWMGARPFETSFLEVEFRGMLNGLTEKYGGSFTMYYPVPDYRYPAAIYSDDYLPKTGDVTNISARLDGPGVSLGSEEEAMAKACKNGTFTKFANSYLGVFERGQL